MEYYPHPPALHPLLRELYFAYSPDAILTILENLPQPLDDSCKALLYIRRAKKGDLPMQDAIQFAQSVNPDGQDINVYLTLLNFWIEIDIQRERLEEADVLIKKAKSFLSEKILVDVMTTTIGAEGSLAAEYGDYITYEKKIIETIAKSNSLNPRFLSYKVMHLTQILCLQGRVSEIQQIIEKATGQKKIHQLQPGSIFKDCLERGDMQEAKKYLKVGKENKNYHYYALYQYMDYFNQLTIPPPYMKIFPTYSSQFKEVDPDYQLTNWLLAVQSLLENKAAESLHCAREVEALTKWTNNWMGFNSNHLIRAELANGNGSAARHLLEKRRSCGNIHYFDVFYFMRISLLENKIDEAVHYYYETRQAVEQYNAQGKLNFELGLSCEMSAGILNLLEERLKTNKLKFLKIIPKENSKRTDSKSPGKGIQTLIGNSSHIRKIKNDILNFGPSPLTLLIIGETGTGKELIARAIHEESPRRQNPFLAINCGAISPSLLESELFGHVRGAFTGAEKQRKGIFEEAGKGTLFLDEIGEMPLQLQPALLRVLETGEIRPVGSSQVKKIYCRILAATNASLEGMVQKKIFRKDLLYRLMGLKISISPLRDRKEDIILIASHFLQENRSTKDRVILMENLKTALKAYAWPGNVRELKNEIERMRLMSSDKISYDVNDLQVEFKKETLATKWLEEDAQKMNLTKPETTKAESSQNPEGEDLAPEILAEYENKLVQINSALKRRQKIHKIFQHFQKLSRRQVMELVNISSATATRDLKILRNENIIEKIEPHASPRSHYFILKNN